MENKNELIQSEDKKDLKEKKPKISNQTSEEGTIIAYAQLVFHTLQHSGTEITPKTIREEVKMFYKKFGNQEVKRLANTIIKEKKEKK